MDRFWSKVDSTGDCWLWRAGRDTAGYGQFRYEGKNTKAHRVAFILHYGYRAGRVKQTCGNRLCVNPSHLEDTSAGIDEKTIKQIRSIPMSRTIVSDVSKEYGISESKARQILAGSIYKNIPGSRNIVRQKTSNRLSIDDIVNIKRELARDRYRGQVSALAHMYGVSHGLISQIRSGLVHGDVSIE